ncbi:MAG: DUF2634 domain-containing protein [Clostridium sp.]|nr:DUF2634 domain-containing protein [Clostridium sp.]
MIPSITPLLNSEIKVARQPTLTWALNLQEGDDRVRGRTEGLAAMRQAVYKIINTERYNYAIYSYNYGIELADLFGQPVSYVCPELERRITEALLQDDRITDVSNFAFTRRARGVLQASFTVQTIFGSLTAEREVNV